MEIHIKVVLWYHRTKHQAEWDIKRLNVIASNEASTQIFANKPYTHSSSIFFRTIKKIRGFLRILIQNDETYRNLLIGI